MNESFLIGELESVLKFIDVIDKDDVVIGDRKNMVFLGSFVIYGRGVILVIYIGMDIEIGNIVNLLESVKEKKILF